MIYWFWKVGTVLPCLLDEVRLYPLRHLDAVGKFAKCSDSSRFLGKESEDGVNKHIRVSRGKILVVDDVAVNLKVVKGLLKDTGLQQLLPGSQLWLGFNPWLAKFQMQQVWP